MQELAINNQGSAERLNVAPEIAHGIGAVASDQEVEIAPWLKNSEESRYLADGVTGDVGIDRLGFQTGYMVSELPASLPIGNRDYRFSNEQSRMTPWAEMGEDERSLYADLSQETISHTSMVPF